VAGIPEIENTFHIGSTLAISGVTFYGLGLMLGPIISTAASELYGRRIIFLISLPLTLAFTVVAGAANHFRIILVMRFLASMAGSPCITVTAGVLNDIWDVREDKVGSLLVAIFAMSVIWAAELGPLVGAAIVHNLNWRWTFWITVILLGFSIIMVFPNPETFKVEILRRRARKTQRYVPQRGNLKDLIFVAVGRPLHMLVIEPLIWPTSLISAINQAIVFCFFVAYPLIFQREYNFTLYQTGFTFVPLFIGSVLAVPIAAFFDKIKYQREKALAKQENRPIAPETRLYPAMVGSVMMPIALFW
jgi:MFS family permease